MIRGGILTLLWLIVTVLGAQNLLLKNATIYTFDQGVLVGYDLLISNGKIAKIGKNIMAPDKTGQLDLTGKSITPGLIDSHNHIGLAGEINESAENVTPEADMALQINPDDASIYYCLTGGVTMVHTMHGSANPIGGQDITIKLKWGKSAEEMIEKRALHALKMALGENPKTAGNGNFFPATRMGVAAVIRNALLDARHYKTEWDKYLQLKKTNPRAALLAPRRDLRLELLLDLMAGKMVVRCHSYRAEESLELMRIAKEFGFKIQAFEHIHQAYRIADELAANHIGISVFCDSWNYKLEASEFTPFGFKLLYEKGVEISLNSDLSEAMRRLFMEAGKMRRYAGMSDLDALKTVTLNPARLLGVADFTGSLAIGKDADIAIFDGHPLSSMSKCVRTLIEGETYFDRDQDLKERTVKNAQVKKESTGGKE